jgi:dGTPase
MLDPMTSKTEFDGRPLTRSLEVAQIGMYIVDKVFLLLDERASAATGKDVVGEWRTLDWQQRLAVRAFVDVACMVHDIGNPPFGHFGEKAIRAWFTKREPKVGVGEEGDRLGADFKTFDGNKQGFRVLTRLQRNLDDRFGLNLTFTQLAATLKYPWRGKDKGSVFESEWELFEQIWEKVELMPEKGHPLALLMEAADDIAYCVSDVEDASTKGSSSTRISKRRSAPRRSATAKSASRRGGRRWQRSLWRRRQGASSTAWRRRRRGESMLRRRFLTTGAPGDACDAPRSGFWCVTAPWIS